MCVGGGGSVLGEVGFGEAMLDGWFVLLKCTGLVQKLENVLHSFMYWSIYNGPSFGSCWMAAYCTKKKVQVLSNMHGNCERGLRSQYSFVLSYITHNSVVVNSLG